LAHQDTEEHDFIEYTAIVKLTRDELGELPSAMRVVGAPPCHFKYGPMPGASGFFRARLRHTGVGARAPQDCLLLQEGACRCLQLALRHAHGGQMDLPSALRRPESSFEGAPICS